MMKKAGISCLLLVVAFLCCVLVSQAIPEMQTKKASDRQFLQDASTSSSWLIGLGELALRQAAGGDVKTFSRRMIEDQGRISEELKELAVRKGIKLSPDNDIVRQNTGTYLSKEYGAAFDRLYMSLLMDEHRRDVALYAEEAEKGRDDEIKAFARRIVTKLKEYEEAARKILADMPKPLLK
jgi:putative membrane protein